MPKILIFTHTSYITLIYMHELVVRARQLDSVAQLVRALHRNRRTAGSIPATGPIVAYFAAAPGYRSNKMCKNSNRNFHLQNPSTCNC